MLINKKKKPRAVVMGGCKRDFPAMAITVINILKACDAFDDDIIILHSGISDEEQKLLHGIYPVIFKKFDLSKFNVDRYPTGIVRSFTLMVFCKFECWSLLSEYEKILWTDYDVYIRGDFRELFNVNSDCAFMCGKMLVNKFNHFLGDYIQSLDGIDFIHGLAVNAGLFVLTNSFPDYMEFYDECFELANSLAEIVKNPEESIISVLLQRKGIKPEPIDTSIYCFNPRGREEQIPENSIILHFAGQPKCWNGYVFKPWNDLQNEWKKMGGRKMKGKNYNIRLLIRDCLPYGIVNIVMDRKRTKALIRKSSSA